MHGGDNIAINAKMELYYLGLCTLKTSPPRCLCFEEPPKSESRNCGHRASTHAREHLDL